MNAKTIFRFLVNLFAIGFVVTGLFFAGKLLYENPPTIEVLYVILGVAGYCAFCYRCSDDYYK